MNSPQKRLETLLAVYRDIVETRMGMPLADYLQKCIDTLDKMSDKGLLNGLGELLDGDMKNFVRTKMRPETIQLLKTYTRENDTVLDFTMGSGSTGIACINTGRRFIGIDHDKGAWDKANARIAKHVNEKL